MKFLKNALPCLYMISFSIFSIGSTFAEVPQDSIYQSQSQWTDQAGKSLTLSSLEGQPTVLSMVYLSCQHTCPLTLSKMKAVEKALGAAAKNTRFVLVSFDPQRDTPEAMEAYFKKNRLHNAQWKLMTSKEADLRELAGLIDFKFKKVAEDEFEHSLALIALDSKGRILGRIEGTNMKPQALAALIRKSVK